MSSASFRKVLFQVHMWIGLILGVLFIVLGLTGSVLVYGNDIAAMITPAPHASAQGSPLPLDQLAQAVSAMAPPGRSSLQITLPKAPSDPAILRFTPARAGFSPGAGGRGQGGPGGEGRGARGPRPDGARGRGEGRGPGGPGGRGAPPGPNIFVDPVSGTVLGTASSGGSPFVAQVHQIHENMFLGRNGRAFVGWLGVGMTILGLSGLVLWWPKRGQWKFAFGVRRSAKGLRFLRELHGMAGIWGFVVFIFVSITGVALGFPQTAQALFSNGAPTGPGGPPGLNFPATPTVEVDEGAKPMGADGAVALVKQSRPDADVRSVTLPARPTQPVIVAIGTGGERPTNLYIDPYRGEIMPSPALPARVGPPGIPWEPLHGGEALGPIWRFLVFLVGFLPLLFVITGVSMWFKKRAARMPMGTPME